MQLSPISPEEAGFSAEGLARIDARLKQYTSEGKIAGVLAMLVRDGKVGYLGCHGFADLAARQPMRPDALFRLYSLTKPITAAAVMALWDDGLLQLDDPLSRFLPEFADLRVFAGLEGDRLVTEPLCRPLTIHDLLTHTSGLAYGLDPITPVDVLYQQQRLLRGDETLAEKMLRLVGLPLLHQPGERVTYSFAFDVLSRVVEVVADRPFDRFLQERFFTPLQMPDTAFNLPPESLERLGGIYWARVGQPLVDLRPLAWLGLPELPEYLCREWIDRSRPMHFLSGGGGLVSSAQDVLHFAQMLLNRGEWQGRRILSSAAVEKMTTHQLPPEACLSGLGSGYGLGVLTDPALVGLPASKGAYGAGGAAGTEFWADPASGTLGVLMIQLIPADSVPLSLEFKLLALQALRTG